MNPVNVARFQTQKRLVVDSREPLLSDLYISCGDDLKTLADSFGRSLPNQHLGISKGDPDEFEDLTNKAVQECRRSFRKLPNHEHRGIPPWFLSL